MRYLFLFSFLLQANIIKAQTMLPVQEFLNLVEQQSPIAKQAMLATRRADEQQRMARGGYDPTVYSYFDNKFFKKKDYYTLFASGLKIPLPIGEAKIGFDVNDGSFLNPEDATPTTGISTIGVSVPLLQGLITDERRTALKQAAIGSSMATIDQKQQITDLLFEAKKAYWDWVQLLEQQQIIQETYLLAKDRLESSKWRVIHGDIPAVDTVEQALATRNWQIEATNAATKTRIANLYAAQFIGQTERLSFLQKAPITLAIAEKLPYSFLVINSSKKLDSVRLENLNSIQKNLLLSLQSYDLKQQNLNLEEKLKMEKLKPKLNVNYNALAQQFDYGSNKYGQFYENYKLGVQFSYPIFSRNERGTLNLTKIKQEELTYMQEQKRIEIQMKMEMYINELNNNIQQINLYTLQLRDYTILRDAEIEKYKMGDSNVFMVNSRDTKRLEANLKLAELKIKHFKYWAVLEWLATTI